MLKGRKSELFAVGFHGFTQQQITRGMIGDGQGIAVALVAELEFPLVVGTP
jgi:hypothetical protein